MDCGPACLRMIARYHGRRCSLRYLRDKSCVTREGTSLLGLSEAAAAIGFKARSVLASGEYLAADAPLPCIVHWEGDHFVVLYKIAGDGFYIADPAYGRARFSREAFLSRWVAAGDEGYALLLEPGDAFAAGEEEGAGRSDLRFLWTYLKPHRRLLGQLLLAMLLGSLVQLVLPFLTQLIVDRGIAFKDVSLLHLILLGQFFLILSRVSVNILRSWILFYIGAPINISLVYDFLVKLARLPLGFFDVKMIGDILERINDHQRVETFMTSAVLGLGLTVFNLAVFGTVLVIYSPGIFLIFLAGTFLYLMWIGLFLRKRREIDFARFRQQGKNHSAIIQLILGMQEIRLNTCEGKIIKGWMNIQSDLFRLGRKSLALTQNQQAGCFLLQETLGIVITYVAARSVIDGSMTLGMMLAVQFILGQLHGPVEQLVQFAASAQDARISFERIEEIRAQPDEEDDPAAKRKDLPEGADIVVSDVSFRYAGLDAEPVLSHIALVLPHRKTTAIVGPSGSGKTTLVKLLAGVYPPAGGDLLIGGVSLADISKSAWRGKCGLVLQDGFIFSDTVAANIALAAGAADEKKLARAAGLANIHDFIVSLPLGYRTVIGAAGQGLSQGQKQRILIARAIYKNPDYLFWDEATNALDAVNEKEILANLENFFCLRTVVLVAHRLSTVKNADQIVVLDGGAVAETGTHEELLARRGAYYRLVRHQLEGEKSS